MQNLEKQVFIAEKNKAVQRTDISTASIHHYILKVTFKYHTDPNPAQLDQVWKYSFKKLDLDF